MDRLNRLVFGISPADEYQQRTFDRIGGRYAAIGDLALSFTVLLSVIWDCLFYRYISMGSWLLFGLLAAFEIGMIRSIRKSALDQVDAASEADVVRLRQGFKDRRFGNFLKFTLLATAGWLASFYFLRDGSRYSFNINLLTALIPGAIFGFFYARYVYKQDLRRIHRSWEDD